MISIHSHELSGYTATAWTPLFPKIKAVVTDTGGMPTHAAITAREYRIPEAKLLRAQATTARREPAYKYLIRMISQLQETAAVSEIGVVGFSMGGHWACWPAQSAELPIVATVIFYAARNGNYSKSRSSFLAHFAETDDWVSAAGIKRLGRSLAKAGKAAQFHTSQGPGHWFFEEDRLDAFQPEAATLGWERTASFLEARFG